MLLRTSKHQMEKKSRIWETKIEIEVPKIWLIIIWLIDVEKEEKSVLKE